MSMKNMKGIGHHNPYECVSLQVPGEGDKKEKPHKDEFMAGEVACGFLSNRVIP